MPAENEDVITCYAQPEKKKSQLVMEAFAQGCGGRMASTWVPRLEAGLAAFYGVRPGWAHLLAQAKQEGRAWLYLDNAWFDCTREKYFRVGRNALQSWTREPSDGARLKAQGARVKPWRKSGTHVLVTPQSEEFLNGVGAAPGWLTLIQRELRDRTDRPIIVRQKGSDRRLADDLEGAHLLVAHSSAAAVEALLAGVPVIVTDKSCAMAEFSSTLDEVENPRLMDGREAWAARLADSQWSLRELRTGRCWRDLP